MKTKQEIEKKIEDIKNDIDEMHKERDEIKNKYGGVSEEYNNDFFKDLHQRTSELLTLEWVLY
jgi:hypothetical protein